jgi:acyl phosphate:glycerol-3-phosphate acyltransferase
MPPSEAWENALPFILTLCLFSFVFGYLLGSIPVGLLLARRAGLGDLRQIGSGNIGATNVLRTGNKPLAALTLLLDLLKGTAAVWLGSHFGLYTALLAGLGAFLGHLYPAWLGFRGGKGVATYLGVLLGLYWPAAIAFCIAWLLVAAATRYSSLAALAASLTSVGTLLITAQWGLAALFLLLTVLIYIRHTANIERLARGEEARIGETKL